MQKTTPEAMDASRQFCPNRECIARGKVGQGNIVSHGCERPRYRCKTCGKTGSRKGGHDVCKVPHAAEVVVFVVMLLSYGCPIQAIVHAFGLDERTVASWRDRAGKQCKQVHQAIVEQGQLDRVQGPTDEIRVKGRGRIVWMGLAMMVSTRLWLAEVVSPSRDRVLADCLLQQVRRCGKGLRAVLVCTDGWAAYPNSIRRAFREKVKTTDGRGQASLQVWPQLYIGSVIKRSVNKRVVEVTRRMTHGSAKRAAVLLRRSRGGSMLNTAFIERFNGTMRERLATLTRKCRHATRRLEALHTGMYLIGCTYNFCWSHHELGKQREEAVVTPAMTASLTDHVWSPLVLLSYKVAPAPWMAVKRRGQPRKEPGSKALLPKRPRGRPRTRPLLDPMTPKHPRGRPRKVALAASTSSRGSTTNLDLQISNIALLPSIYVLSQQCLLRKMLTKNQAQK